MLTIDSQVHAYERNHPGRPWHGVLAGPPEVTGDQMVAHMDAAGIDGAILVSAFTMYRYDASYALEVKKRHPGRFAVVKPVDPAEPAVAEIVADWKRTPGAVGVRMLLVRSGLATDPADPGLNRVLATAARHSLPVNLHIAGRLDQGLALIRRNADTQIIVATTSGASSRMSRGAEGTMGRAPAGPGTRSARQCRDQGQRHLHVVAHAVPVRRHLWDPVRRIIDAFGIDRCMWRTDWTRAVKFLSYAHAFRLIDRLSESDKAKLLGGTLARIYGWSPRAA
jgi:L-fuconolactonase